MFGNNRCPSTTSLKMAIGDLMSGRAFDNNCNCLDIHLKNQQLKLDQRQQQQQRLNNKENHPSNGATKFYTTSTLDDFDCVCNAPRLAPEFEFTKALISIGKKLVRLASKELKTQRLMSELAIINMNLPARVWLPLFDFPHYVVRIPYRSAAVLNSKEKAPYIMYVEVLECENVHTEPLVVKLLDNNLKMVKSEENLTNAQQSSSSSGDITHSNSHATNLQLLGNSHAQDFSEKEEKQQEVDTKNHNHSPKSNVSVTTEMSTFSAPTILLNSTELTSTTTKGQQSSSSATESSKTTPNNAHLLTSKSHQNPLLTDNLSDCWSIHSDSGLQNYNGYGINFKSSNSHENSNFNGEFQLLYRDLNEQFTLKQTCFQNQYLVKSKDFSDQVLA